MLSVPQLKALVAGNAVLSAAVKAGDVQLVYPKKPTISEDRLYGVYTLEVLLVEKDEADLVEGALRRGGFEYKKTKQGWLASYSFALTPSDREKMEKADKAAKDQEQAVKLAKKDNEIQTALAELRTQVAELKEDSDLAGLLKPKAGARGPAGPAGPPGPPGPPGSDAAVGDLELGDLKDVDDIAPEEGMVLMWAENIWQPRFAPRSGGGGGGGGAGGLKDAPEDGSIYGRMNGEWIKLSNIGSDCGEHDGGAACDPEQLCSIDGGDDSCGQQLPCPIDMGGACNSDDSGSGNGLVHWYETSDGHFLPVQGGLQNIGSLTQPVQELYITGNTVFMDGVPLSINSTSGRLEFDGNQLGYGDGDVTEAPQDGQEYVRKDGAWVVGGGGTGDVEEAPSDGTAYIRKDGQWLPQQDEFLGEAPQDGNEYTRQNGQWVVSTTASGGIPDAPQDGKDYVRNNGQWVETDLSVNCCDRVTQLEQEVEELRNLVLGLIGSGGINIDAITLEDNQLIELEDGTIFVAESGSN